MLHSPNIRRTFESLRPILLLVIASVLAVAWVQAPRLLDHFKVDEDFRSFYWMQRFQISGLFPEDQFGHEGYVDIHLPWGELPISFHSPGYGLLFYAASFLVNPVLFTKLLPFFLMTVSVIYLFNYGRSVRDDSTGITLAVGFLFLNLICPTSISVISGFQRSFACPLIIALLYYLHQANSIGAAVTVVVSALIFPPNFLIAVATWVLHAAEWQKIRELKLPITGKELGILLIALLLSVAVLAPLILSQLTEAASSTTSSPPVLQDPRYRPGGRNPLFHVFPFVGPGGLVTKGIDAVHLVILASIGGLIVLVRGPSRISLPREVMSMLWASLFLFLLAWSAALVTNSFLLYKPSRYTRGSLFLFSLMFVLLNIREGVEHAVTTIRRGSRKSIWLVVGVEIAALSLILLYPSSRTVFLEVNMKWLLALASLLLAILSTLSLAGSSTSVSPTKSMRSTSGRVFIGIIVAISLLGWGAYAGAAARGYTLDPQPAEREMLAFLETLPKGVLLAGTPCILDNVPLFAKRQILFSCEQLSPDEDLMREALDAYYAEEIQAVLDFCRAYSVDYLVINRHTYTEEYIEGGWLFFEPYNGELLPRVKARDTFALAEVPDDGKVFEADGLFVVPCTEAALR